MTPTQNEVVLWLDLAPEWHENIERTAERNGERWNGTRLVSIRLTIPPIEDIEVAEYDPGPMEIIA